MTRLKKNGTMLRLAVWSGVLTMGAAMAQGQGTPGAGTPSTQAGSAPLGAGAAHGQAPGTAAPVPPLQLHSLDPATRADPFPPVNAKFFTATTPTVATVDSYLQTVLGYDASRIWRVEAVEKTPEPGLSKVVVYVSDRAAGSKVQTAIFFVTPDGKFALAEGQVVPFGAKPYADTRAKLQAEANGPWRGAESKDLELVEFTDLQCPHCKEAQTIMQHLGEDFPKARIVVENYPLTELHPWAMRAAEYGVCVATHSNAAFFTFADTVYNTQGALTEDTGDETLRAAVTKAGLDAVEVSTCATGASAKAGVDASIALGDAIGVNETPILAVNGRLVPLTIPYETLKSIIVHQANEDGVAAAAVSPEGHGLIGR